MVSSLKRLFEVELVDGKTKTCVVLADDAAEVPKLLPRPDTIVSIRPTTGLISAVGSSRILSWVMHHEAGEVSPP